MTKPLLLCLAFLLFSPRAAPAAQLDPYGGDLRIQGVKTGRFHIQQLDGRYWIITPEGHGWWSIGVGVVWPGDARQKYETSASQWASDCTEFLSTTVNSIGGNPFDFDYKWAQALRDAETKIPYFLSMHPIEDGYHSLHKKARNHSSYDPDYLFPDIFKPSMQNRFLTYFKRRLSAFKDDPYLVGIFTNNENSWGVRQWGGWWADMVARDRTAPGKQEFVATMQRIYRGDFHAFKDIWFPSTAYRGIVSIDTAYFGREPVKTNHLKRLKKICQRASPLQSWDALLDYTHAADMLFLTRVNKRAFSDVEQFLGVMSQRYHRLCYDALQEAAPEVLNFGCRLVGGGNAPEYMVPRIVIKNMVPYVDAVAYNIYWNADPRDKNAQRRFLEGLRKVYEATGLPILLSEMGGFMAENHPVYGNKQDFYVRVADQNERAERYNHFVKTFARLPYAIGLHHSHYIDHFHTNWGIVDANFKPYLPICHAMRQWRDTIVSYRLESGWKFESRKIEVDF